MSAKAEKATDPRGLKRICTDCGTRFYDMNSRPITCPSCKTEFTGEIKVKTRRSKAAAAVEEAEGQVKKAAKDETVTDEIEEEEDTTEAEIVSLDDLETAEAEKDDDDTPSADIALDSDDLDEIEVADDDLGDLQDLEPDAEDIEDDAEEEAKE